MSTQIENTQERNKRRVNAQIRKGQMRSQRLKKLEHLQWISSIFLGQLDEDFTKKEKNKLFARLFASIVVSFANDDFDKFD